MKKGKFARAVSMLTLQSCKCDEVSSFIAELVAKVCSSRKRFARCELTIKKTASEKSSAGKYIWRHIAAMSLSASNTHCKTAIVGGKPIPLVNVVEEIELFISYCWTVGA